MYIQYIVKGDKYTGRKDTHTLRYIYLLMQIKEVLMYVCRVNGFRSEKVGQ